ncbi:MAG: hypothetical protein H8E27_10255 [Verrucomicrobia subdivision 3 bacterium]|nr:hypothetical protein [Limisphaerales bacterium]
MWSDFLDVGFGLPTVWHNSVVCSQRVIDDMEKAGITGLKCEKLKLKKYLDGWKKPPPRDYYVLLPEPGVSVDFSKCNFSPEADGTPPLEYILGDDPLWEPFYGLDFASWNQKDLFGYRNKFLGKRADEMVMDVFCTEKVAELAKRKKWSNCNVKERPWEMVEGVDPNAEKRANFEKIKKLLNDDQDDETKALNDHLRSLRSD